MFHRKYCNYSNVYGDPLCSFHDNWGTIRNTAFTHSSKKAWNNFWHFSARSSLIIWPAFGFVPCSTRSIFCNKLLLQSYNNNELSVPSNTRSTRAVSEFSREMLYHVIIFAPPGSNQILACRCCHCNWTIVANHSRAFCSGEGVGGYGIMLRSDTFYKHLNNRSMSRIENRKSIMLCEMMKWELLIGLLKTGEA